MKILVGTIYNDDAFYKSSWRLLKEGVLVGTIYDDDDFYKSSGRLLKEGVTVNGESVKKIKGCKGVYCEASNNNYNYTFISAAIACVDDEGFPI